MPPSSKFAGVDFSELPVEHLTSELTISGQGFRCLRGEFVTYWRQGRIQREIDARISQCWILPTVGVRFMTVDALYDPDTTPPYDRRNGYKPRPYRTALIIFKFS